MLRQILKLAYYEILHILKDPILCLMVFIAPLAYASLFGAVYVASVLNDIPLAIVNQDNSELSRDVVAAYRNDPHFKIIAGIESYEELEAGMKTGKVRAGVVIPANFSQKLSQNGQTEVLTVYDASNLIWGYNIRKNTLEVVNKFSADHTAAQLAGAGLSKHEIQNVMNTIDCNITVWYNPTFSYVNFLFMGLIVMILHQLGILGVALTITREKERNTWLQYLTAAIPAWKITLGKCLPYLVINFCNYVLLIWLSSQFVHVKIQGSVFLIILLGLLFDIIVTFAGFLISVYTPNSLMVTRYIMLLSVPFFMVSGYTWPHTHIPELLNGMARLLPSTWMMEGFRLVTIKNLTMTEVGPIFLIMGLMAFLFTGLSLTFRKQSLPPNTDDLAVNCGSTYPRE